MRTTTTIKKILIFLFALANLQQVLSQNSKTIISEGWKFENSSNSVLIKAKSKTDVLKNVYVVGAILNSQNNRDLIIQKLDPLGNLLWQNIINGDANMDDVGTDVYVDDQFFVYVTGTVKRLGTQEDLTVLKYSSNGTLVWDYYTNSIESENGIALTKNANKLYVTGVTSCTSTLNDFLTISLDASNGSFIWSEAYNYANLNEVPVSIRYRDNKLFITGASQASSSPYLKWEIVTLIYDAASGIQNSENRTTGNSTQGVDEVNDIAVDANGYVYIVGGVVNQSTGFDVALYKLDNNLNLIWEQFIDENGLDDVANGVKLDSNGNIYITGYTTQQNEGKNIFVKKFDNNGVNIWSKALKGQSNLDDVGVQLSLVQDTTIYVAGYIRNNLDADCFITGFNSNGTIISTIDYADPSNLDDIPTSISTDLDGNLILSVQNNYLGGYRTKTIKYHIYNRSINYSYDSLTGKPKAVNNNIIIRFSKNAVNVNTYLNKKIKAGPASLFLNSLALNEMSIKTGIIWNNFRCFKIHSTFGPNDSLSITRVGDTIPTNDFWTALLIEAPSDISESTLIDSLLTIHDYIRTASLNSIFFTSSVPNDTYYPSQYGLFQNDIYPNADINVETAWLNEVGNENIKVGVIDHLINYYHPDFGDGTYQGSKVRGYSCLLDQDISNYQISPNNSHGTAVGGIIGALRNNGIGIAGIAGGDVQASNKGVRLFNFVVFHYDDQNGAESIDVIEALALGNLATTDNNGYGVHIQNMSLGSVQANGELFETLIEGFKNGCAYVAARGNKGFTTNAIEFPACYNNDKVIMNVIASGTNGNRKILSNGANEPDPWESSYGYVCPLGNCVSCDKVDFMAPGTIELIKTTISPGGMPFPYISCDLTSQFYDCFNGTSAAAPHVTGVAALMMSKHQPSNGYPNRLISEDLERILEKNAFSQTPAFSLESGYGRINAGAALSKVTDPYYIKHVKVPVSSIQSLGISIGLFTVYNNYFGVPTGNYDKVETFKCTWNQTDNLISGHNIIDYWKMEALTQLGSIFQSPPPTAFMVGGNIIQNENLQVYVGGNSYSFSGFTHTYKLTNSAGVSYWFPAPPSGLNYTYSLHVLKQADASVSELADDKFIIFPNPAKNEIEIQLKNNYEGEVKIEIVDEIGRVVVNTLYKKDSNKKINVSHLKDGVYFCNLVYGDFVATKPFIKTK